MNTLARTKIINRDIDLPSEWLKSFLAARGLNKATGKALYEYQATKSEWQSLLEVVTSYKNQNLYGIGRVHWSACFTLFSALWYQRQYESNDGWSWNGIWQELDCALTAAQIEKAVTQGIQSFWQRPIKTYIGRRNFLGSVFAEGGLPFKLLTTNDNNFAAVLKRILNQLPIAKALGEPTENLVAHHVANLPKAFNEQESIQLITKIAEKLVFIVETFCLEEQAEPAVYLDKVAPKWRDDFPIPLDNETGTGIVNNWLKQATVEGKKRVKLKDKLFAEHLLNIHDLTLTSRVQLPTELAFQLPSQELKTNRLELILSEAGKEREHLGVVYLSIQNGLATFKVRNRHAKLLRQQANSQLELHAIHAGTTIHKWVIDKTQVGLNDVPVGFVKKDNEYHYIGQATFSHKQQDIYLFLPNTTTTQQVTGTLDPISQDLLYKLNGEVLINQSDDTFRIKSGDLFAANLNIELYGDTLLFDTKPESTYVSSPRYRLKNNELEAEQELKEFYGKIPVTALNKTEQYGRHTLSLKNTKGETLLKQRVGVLPAGFNIETQAGSNLGEGKIKIQTPINMVFEIPTKGISFTKTKISSNEVALDLKCDGMPPADIELHITPNILSKPVSVSLPYPQKGIFAFDAHGLPLAEQLAIDDLLGSRLHVYSPHDYATPFDLEFILEDRSKNPPYYKHSFVVEQQTKVLNLYSFKDKIEELLSLKPDLDAEVSLQITCRSVKKKFTINRYSCSLKDADEANCLQLAANTKQALEGIELCLMQMSNPESKPLPMQEIMSEEVNTGLYQIPDVKKSEGPWLVIPSLESTVRFRPKLLTYHLNDDEPAQQIDESEEAKTLQQAVKLFHPKFNPNAITTLIEAMSENIQHSSWEYLLKLYQNYAHLPLSTFQVWKELVNNPKALLLCLYRFEAKTEFIVRLEAEFPILWQTYPLTCFIETYTLFKQWFLDKDIPQAMAENITVPMLENIINNIAGLDKELSGFIQDPANKVPSLMPMPVMESIILGDKDNLGWLQKLINDHAENEEWPSAFGHKLQNWYQTSKLNVLPLHSPNRFQSAVIYLPVFMAAVAANKAQYGDVFDSATASIYALKQVRDFDPSWFSSMYSYHLCKFLDLA